MYKAFAIISKGFFFELEMDKSTVIDKLLGSKSKLAKQTSYQRSSILNKIAAGIRANKQALADTIVEEAFKPIKYALVEVDRTVAIFEIAAEESKRLPKEYLDLDWAPGKPREGFVKYFPIGPVLGITPFNFPLNLIAHKVGPAIACGCPILIKPSPRTPKIAHLLIEIIVAAGIVENSVMCVEMRNEEVASWVEDERFKMISFTGSPDIGWYLKSIAGKKKVALELGGNAGAIITETTNINKAAKKCVAGGYAYSGQVCIHTQRVYVKSEYFDHFISEFQSNLTKLKFGDLTDPSTDFGKMISEEAAIRVESWIDEAQKDGARVLAGGKRHGDFIEPTLITNTTPDQKIVCEEIFGPVVVVEKYDSFEEVIAELNESRFGLQAGLFTDSQVQIKYAFENLEVGGLMINEVPTYRADHMPYGGVKDSGFGREGLKYSILEMMESKIMVI
ncbi:MAG: acyl-CoA reductase-like NAD-dependent aldehyde dehydrogenase [Parvicellaceae bacterium]|jgi:acyl-CoA reductase-like NAD-dependent aldehyde dehydrogenase